MGFLRSSIVLKAAHSWKATITTSYYYFYETEEIAMFTNLKDARNWIISKRCKIHIEILD